MIPPEHAAAIDLGRECPTCKTRCERDPRCMEGGTAADTRYRFNCLNCGASWDVAVEVQTEVKAVPAEDPGGQVARPIDVHQLEIELRRRGARIHDAGMEPDGRIGLSLSARGIKVTLTAETLDEAVRDGFALLDRCIATALARYNSHTQGPYR